MMPDGQRTGAAVREDERRTVIGPDVRDRRLALLVALLINLPLLVGYYLYTEVPSPVCYAGALCGFPTLPGVLQGLLILAGFGMLWLLLYLFVQERVERPGKARGLVAALRALSRYESIRGLLAIYAVGLWLLAGISLWLGRLSLDVFLLAALTALTCAWCGALPRRIGDPLEAFDGPLMRLRALPPFSWYWPPAPSATDSPRDRAP